MSIGKKIAKWWVDFNAVRPLPIVKKGIFDKAEYLPASFGGSSTTIVYFENGSSYVLRGMYDMDGSRGQKLVIREKGCIVTLQWLKKASR